MDLGVDPVRAWLATAAVTITALVAGVLAFPGRVYDGFLWRYFWGPVVADGNAAQCAVRSGGATELHASSSACAAADGIVAYAGYTTVSTVSYGIVLVFMLIGVLLLLERLGVELSHDFFYALFPYMLLGGALRTVEDVNARFLREGASAPIPFPESALIISPIIYFVMFAVTLSVLIVGLAISRRGYVEQYEYFLAAVGVVALTGTVGWLLYVSATSELVGFYPIVAVITLVGSTVVAWLYWMLSERYAPGLNAGTGFMGVLVVWGHTVDGIANVVSLDWAVELGLPITYGSKHVINEAIVNTMTAVQPAWLSEAIGTAWPFLFVKIAAAVVVVYVFEETIFEESPRYAYLLFIAILAVGLGPGTRDMLRATLGI